MRHTNFLAKQATKLVKSYILSLNLFYYFRTGQCGVPTGPGGTVAKMINGKSNLPKTATAPPSSPHDRYRNTKSRPSNVPFT